jgi:hypothetical protein
MVFPNHEALTPVGNPVAVPIPVAPVVLWVILVNALLEQTVGLELAADAVLLGNCAATLNEVLAGEEQLVEFVAVTV